VKEPAATTVLVAEDNREILEVLVHAIEKLGFRVVSARDGSTALELARSTRPDLAVLDVGMPGIDGLELTRLLKGTPETAHAKVLLVTAYADPPDRLAGFEAGADEYLAKPFELGEFLALLGRLTP
jgi:CheY-like chemotaxis protein